MANPWLDWWTDKASVLNQPTFPRLLIAMLLGCVIGAERQWRQRAAGLRTNALVCFGAAAFVDLGATVGGPTTTNIIAYVISGVGFLGAGAIMKEGGSIRGLNTAATLWCSAAVGACAGAGELLDAVFMTAILITINLALRPLSRRIDRRFALKNNRAGIYRLLIAAKTDDEREISSLVLRSLATRPLTLRELRTEENDESGEMIFDVLVESGTRDKTLIESVAGELRLNAKVSSATWSQATLESD
jgi:putative Mg2+ transporter-C (MgtC) family protein